MTVTSTNQTAASTAAGVNAAANKSIASGADFTMFLKLLTTQMQNQDPLSPMDTAQYTQQLVQYSQVEQSMQQTGVLKDILSRLTTQNLGEVSALIGREVEIDSAKTGLTADAAAHWRWSTPRPAATMIATVYDASGKKVSTQAVPATGAAGDYSWNGKLASGAQAPAGAYTLKLEAKDASDASLPVAIRSVGLVQDVRSADNKVSIGFNGIALSADKIVRVTGS